MNKKRLVAFMIGLYTCTTIFPSQTLFADTEKASIVIEAPTQIEKTTDGQIGVGSEGDRTTSGAIEVAQLEALIQQGEKLSQEAPIGTTPGTYKIEAKQNLDQAIQEAKEAKQQAQTPEVLGQVIEKLNQAIIDFKSSRTVDIGQLALAAYHYGVLANDTTWEQAMWLDINNDGQVAIEDLSYIASQMIK